MNTASELLDTAHEQEDSFETSGFWVSTISNGDNLEVVWAIFSTLSFAVLLQINVTVCNQCTQPLLLLKS